MTADKPKSDNSFFMLGGCYSYPLNLSRAVLLECHFLKGRLLPQCF